VLPVLAAVGVAVILSTRPRLSEMEAKEANIRASLAIDDGRLGIRDVTVKTLQPEYAIVAAGVTAGERLIVSDLFPAIDGMGLQAEPDPDVRARLLAAATGGPSPPER